MARRKAVTQLGPTLAPDRALRELSQQLEDLQKLKGRDFEEAHTDETECKLYTESIVEAAFGISSTSLAKFYSARSAGVHNLLGISPQQRQLNFESRVNEFEALLRSLIKTLKLQLPEEKIVGVYEPGNEYAFYRDLSSLIATATNDILIVDAYLDDKLFNLYVSQVPTATTVRILSNKIRPDVDTIARMYATGRPLELRSSENIHDRLVFLDKRGWVVGQSIKDAARKKPTHLIELNEPSLTATRNVHNAIWAKATIII